MVCPRFSDSPIVSLSCFMSSRFPDGVVAASLTPFHEDLSVDADALAAHVQWLLERGCDGVLLFGTTGEGLSLSVAERIGALDAVLEAGVAPERLLVGTGAAALPDAVQLTRAAARRTVGGALVLPPFHFRQVPPEGLYRFYDRLVREVATDALRLYFYHFPALSGVPIPFPLMQRLREAHGAQIAGIKDSSAEWDHTEALCRDFPALQVFSGTERLLLPVLEAGGAGCISATVNVTAPLAAQVRREWDTATDPAASQDRLRTLRAAFASVPTIPALKQLLARGTGPSPWDTVRPPLAPLGPETARAVEAIAEQLVDAGLAPTLNGGPASTA